ncbi:hypothetical protein Scep_005069 [Stephania cephalantha]|uniref:Uncharacterized protein n=1 Tax=Stephania cephalantha TaxID=152367 RepID=A0AAP0KUI8_9MAGN
MDPAPPDARDRLFKALAAFQGRLGVELSFGENFSLPGPGVWAIWILRSALEKENDMDMVRGLLETVIDVDFVVPASDPSAHYLSIVSYVRGVAIGNGCWVIFRDHI